MPSQIIDVVVIFAELFIDAEWPACRYIERDAVACCPGDPIARGFGGPEEDKTGSEHLDTFSREHLDTFTEAEAFWNPALGRMVFTPENRRALASDELCGPDEHATTAYCDDHKHHGAHTVHTVLFYISVSILALFEIELLACAAAIGGLFFRNPLYVLDLFVVTASLTLELVLKFLHKERDNASSRQLHLLIVDIRTAPHIGPSCRAGRTACAGTRLALYEDRTRADHVDARAHRSPARRARAPGGGLTQVPRGGGGSAARVCQGDGAQGLPCSEAGGRGQAAQPAAQPTLVCAEWGGAAQQPGPGEGRCGTTLARLSEGDGDSSFYGGGHAWAQVHAKQADRPDRAAPGQSRNAGAPTSTLSALATPPSPTVTTATPAPLGQAERHTQLRSGLILKEVGTTVVAGQSYQEVLSLIRNGGRPLTMTFAPGGTVAASIAARARASKPAAARSDSLDGRVSESNTALLKEGEVSPLSSSERSSDSASKPGKVAIERS